MANTFFNKVLSPLINKQFKLKTWHEKLSQNKQRFYPCICVSRETGSGGRLIAEIVARRLKMKLYDKEFVELISQSAKKTKEVVHNLDEKSQGVIEGILASLAQPKNKMAESVYFKHLCKVILSLAKKNPSVLLGRGANYIIPIEYSLRVRVIAPLKVRIANSVKYEKKSLAKAKETIRKIHFSRKDFVQRFFHKNISDANDYDLVINTEFLSLEQAVSLIITAFRHKFDKLGQLA